MPTILLPWVEQVGLRHQGVLMSAVRGCDNAERNDNSKAFHRLLRGAILRPHAGRFIVPGSYILYEPDQNAWWVIARKFMDSFDHYPNHFILHLIHATEVIGYCAPDDDPVFSSRWKAFYYAMVHALHLNPETEEQMNIRLNADERSFARLNEPVVIGGKVYGDEGGYDEEIAASMRSTA